MVAADQTGQEESYMSVLRIKVLTCILILAAVFVVMTDMAASASDEGGIPAKRGVLLVAFGSSLPEGQAAINAVEDAVRSAYPDVEVRVSFTSRIIMRKIAREQNKIIDEPAVALAKMAYEGFTDVVVMSTHVIPGAEYQDLEAVVDGFKLMHEHGTKAGFRYIALSKPLLSGGPDFERMAQVMTSTYNRESGNGAVIFVGHGTHHFADSAYSTLQVALWQRSPNFFVGTIEGLPAYDDVLAQLKKTKNKNVVLAPAMLVAGDHATNDIGGSEDDSWKSMLTAEGYNVTPKFVGLGQNEAVRNLLIDKLREAWGDNAP
jgi:sirohydrochlorin cobaltochelatase